MAHVIKDKVAETSTTTGTGALTLAGAITGYKAFSDVMTSPSDTCHYTITGIDADGIPTGEWETGLGTYSGANTLTRTTVIASSNSDAAVNFSAGTKRVTMSLIAASIIGQGTHTIPVLAQAMTPNTTSGPASGTSESTTNKVMLSTLDFDASTDESAQIVIPMDKKWDEGTVTVQFIWTAGATGDVVWACQAVALSNDDAVDSAFGTAQTVTDSVTLADDVMESAFTSAITIAGTPAAEDLVVFKFYRDADNGGDTLAADAKLIAVRIKYTINAVDDS